jgi:hypothetical protein
MRKKSGLTIVEQAVVLVPEFEKVVRKLDQQVALRGQSKSTLNNANKNGHKQVAKHDLTGAVNPQAQKPAIRQRTLSHLNYFKN